MTATQNRVCAKNLLIRNSGRSSDRLWLACRIMTLNISTWRTTAAGAVGPGYRPLQVRPEKLELHQPLEPLERIPPCRQLLQTLVNLEETRLTPHPTSPVRIHPTES
jgi:hypothetical protein